MILQGDRGSSGEQIDKDDGRRLEWVEEIVTRVETLVAGQSNAQQRTYQVVQANNQMLKRQLAAGLDTPPLACVLCPWKPCVLSEGLSSSEQDPANWGRKLDEDAFKKSEGFLKTKMRLLLLCAHSHRLVPCGPLGQGYELQHVRKWVKNTVGVVNMMLRITLASLCGAVGAELASTALDEAVGAAFGVAREEIESVLRSRLDSLAVGEGDTSPECQQDVSKEDVVSAIRPVFTCVTTERG